MIFGVQIENPEMLGNDISAHILVDHYEAFSILIVAEHGRGPEPFKSLTKTEFNDVIAGYGIDPDDPEFKNALRRMRVKKAITRKNFLNLELGVAGAFVAFVVKENSENLEVDHPLPTIEALAAILRYGQEHVLYSNATVFGGVTPDQLHERAFVELFAARLEYQILYGDKEIRAEQEERTLEAVPGSGLAFMYDGRVYGLHPGWDPDNPPEVLPKQENVFRLGDREYRIGDGVPDVDLE